MSETIALVLSICAFIFSALAFVGAAVAATIVIGWSKSSHKIIQVPSEDVTRFEYDLPKEIMDQLPSNPNIPSPEAYLAQKEREEELENDAFSQEW